MVQKKVARNRCVRVHCHCICIINRQVTMQFLIRNTLTPSSAKRVSMGSYGGKQLHIFLFPFMAPGHMIPISHIAKLFASRGLKATIVTTPANVLNHSKSIQRDENLAGGKINFQVLKFPAAEVGLPEGCENIRYITGMKNMSWEMVNKFMRATKMLQEPLEQLLRDHKPDCLVADMFFPWATDSAAKFGIPRLVFHGSSFFSLCVFQCLRLYQPHKKVSSDTEPFILPYIPGDMELTRMEVSLPEGDEGTEISKLWNEVAKSDSRSYGVLVNSFYELEPAYADHYRNVFGIKAWHIGPVSLSNQDIAASAQNECLKWLDSKKPQSVVYICFGSMGRFSPSQLKEIAIGLKASERQFIWVVNQFETDDQGEEDWLPEGFEERMEGKGLIIRGWAPQVLILDHKAIGGLVTHCGWNSILEGITSGVPMVTWPIGADQFYNEKLVTKVLKIGIPIGVQSFALSGRVNIVKSEAIEKAVHMIMEGEEAEEMRSKASELKEMARNAIMEGGSSFSDLTSLIEELGLYRHCV